MSNELTVQQKAVSLRDFLFDDKRKETFASALPQWLSVDRILRTIFSTAVQNPKIMDCTKESILSSVMNMCQLGIEPLMGRGHLIPYSNSKKIGGQYKKFLECQFQIGYQGLIDLARRSGTISDVYAHIVYENDDFNISFGLDKDIIHRPWYMFPERQEGGSGKIIGAYAVWKLKDGTKHPEFMPIVDIYKRRDGSQAYQYAIKNKDNKGAQDTPWIKWEEEMILKTVIKHSAKMVPASIEFMGAVELDTQAELGKSQLSPLLSLPDKIDSFDIPEPEPEELTDDEVIRAFDQLIKENGLNVKVVESQVLRASEYFGTSETGVKRGAIEKPQEFISAYEKFKASLDQSTGPAGSEEGGKSENESANSKLADSISKMKNKGLDQFEKDNVISNLAPEVRKAFLERWSHLKKHDYFAEGQPGYAAPPEEGNIVDAEFTENNVTDQSEVQETESSSFPPAQGDKISHTDFGKRIIKYRQELGDDIYFRVISGEGFERASEIVSPQARIAVLDAMERAKQDK